MKHNKILYFQHVLNGDWDRNKLLEHLCTVLNEMVYIYSYTVRVNRLKESIEYNITYGISEESKYNVLYKNEVIKNIIDTLEQDKLLHGKHIIGYGQPPLDLMIELYEPLIQKLAVKQNRHWKQLEYDDLCQICRMTLVILYNKGYYIHRRLLEKAFNNAVLQEVKKLGINYDIISFETQSSGDKDMEKLTLLDTIQDKEEEERKQDEDIKLTNRLIFEEVKTILIDEMGVRQFEQLFRDYANKHTSSASRKKMINIRYKFEKEGLTRQNFNNKYGR